MSGKRRASREAAVPQKRSRVSEEDDDSEGDLSQAPDFVAPASLKEAEYGIIESISLKNFMCHGSLLFNFGPNVNFVVGRNGSGKSAVLTGVVVGLGGKASITNRGGSLKEFIKAKQNQALITIKLRNQGSDAYRPELYGKSIIVERKISLDGGSSYKLKSADKKTISLKKEELDHILDQFNIQVGNPVSILNQDTSRNFLNSKNPQDKYRFFMKATQLEQMSSEYVKIQEDIAVTEETLRKKDEVLPVLERNVDNLRRKVEDLSSLQTLVEKKLELVNTQAWAIVAAEEKEMGDLKKEFRVKDASTTKYTDKVVVYENKVCESEKAYDEIQKEINDLGAKMKEVQPQHAMAKDQMQTIKQNVKKIEKSIRDVKNQLRNVITDKEELEARINELRNSAQQDFEEEKRIREEQMRALNENMMSLEATMVNTEMEIDQMSNSVNQAKTEMYQLKSQNGDIDQNIRGKRRNLAQLKGSRQDRLKLYGNYMPNLLNEIDKADKRNMFHRKPKGPLGKFLNLKDPEWALGIEVILKSLVYCFCCNDYHDEKILKEIMQRVIRDAKRPTIITSKFEDQKYDVSRQAVHCDIYPTVLHPSVLEVDDPVIYNCLIDQRSVELVLLIKDKTEARDFLKNRPPNNCREGFTLEGDQIYAGADQRFYSAFQKNAKVLRGDVEAEIRDTEEDIENLEREKLSSQGRLQELQTTIRDTERHTKKMQQQRLKLQDSIGQIRYDLQQLASTEEPAPIDVYTLEEDLQTQTKQQQLHEQELDQLGLAFKDKHREHEAAKEKFAQLHEEMRVLADTVDPLKDQLHLTQDEVVKAKHDRTHYVEKKKGHLKEVSALQKALDAKQKEIEVMIGKAKKVHEERIHTIRKPRSIDSEIHQITKRIDKEKEQRGDPVEIKREHQEAKLKLEEIKLVMGMLKNFVQMLHDQMRVRQMAFAHFRKYIALRTRYYFVLTLDQRGYNGKMTFNHKKEELLLRVQPSQGSSQGSSDMKALSGGERSFSTVCFIMALWESMETPFRALDEFDVFMDMVNRKISMDLMMKVAKEQKSRQFIFLTPQDMSKIGSNPLVRISRMPDPDRTGNQSRLPFIPVGEEEEEDGRGDH